MKALSEEMHNPMYYELMWFEYLGVHGYDAKATTCPTTGQAIFTRGPDLETVRRLGAQFRDLVSQKIDPVAHAKKQARRVFQLFFL